MQNLSELYTNIIERPITNNYGITCERLNDEFAVLNHKLNGGVSIFSFNLVTEGSAHIIYDDKDALLKKNDLYIYTPGMRVCTLEVSDDYSGYCLMGEETTTYNIPYARNIIKASYYPALANNNSVLSLEEEDSMTLARRMEEIVNYSTSSHLYQKDCLYSLYSLFILDLLNIEHVLNGNEEDTNPRTIDLFLRFFQLLSENFKERHDLSFYADRLAVTSIYLSRIVKRFSGQTVKNHVDRFLLMEASFLLSRYDLQISEIAEILGFANQASFCKFFSRNKGLSPSVFRASRT